MDIWMFLLGVFGIPLLCLILFFLPWKKLKKSHYPLGPDGISKKAKRFASDTIVMGYMNQDPTRDVDPVESERK